jgi:predicted nucleic acid-binding protein
MYLWGSNVLRYYFKQYPTLPSHLRQVSKKQIALPSVVVAEALRGRCEYLLKATPEQVQAAEQRLTETIQTVQDFAAVAFDETSATVFAQMLKQHKSKGRYADLMIAATPKPAITSSSPATPKTSPISCPKRNCKTGLTTH